MVVGQRHEMWELELPVILLSWLSKDGLLRAPVKPGGIWAIFYCHRTPDCRQLPSANVMGRGEWLEGTLLVKTVAEEFGWGLRLLGRWVVSSESLVWVAKGMRVVSHWQSFTWSCLSCCVYISRRACYDAVFTFIVCVFLSNIILMHSR